ncbi:radical SAM family heme chaperone HemW [Carboxydothermus hydrogenoformans]|uniref:Heme chaperone HemW n=1 Tax=Carboxydothermus hydrogenoformans (strain ATCC BAA-161 / DSM 6008 / Z-2901) TaxID=246194 RepID=Q3AF12_CARHZ|nr:radical SAM family heme chaperone HemW [Carboxydothermus hydrogenoformans]ABB15393.1 putative oxygen-independent coproporphyrinogen III oxidase [Carboxydothermus hydrogenoformans Z-2901]
MIITNKAQALYLHMPFCLKKCHYCAFTSFPAPAGEGVFSYLSLIKKELEWRKDFLAPLKTIYVGGGTPTSLSLNALEKLGEIISPYISDKLLEFTVEANPGTLNREKIRLLKDLGVNRVSLGAQSFNDEILLKMGRAHTAAQTLEAYNLLREEGINNLNLDLIIGYPEGRESFINTVKTAISLKPEHISLYDLKVEENTRLYEEVAKGEIILPEEDEVVLYWEEAINLLEENGYERYEIANFARNQQYSRHNLTYWENKPYLGIGLAAHSKVGLYRFWNPNTMLEYREMLLTGKNYGEEKLTLEEDAKEEIILRLRLKTGLNLQEFQKKYRRDFMAEFGDKIQKFIELGLLFLEDDRLFLTRKGSFVANTVLIEFI